MKNDTYTKEIDVIEKKLAPVFVQNKVKKAVVFGAMARGSESTKSDLDLMIIK